jgi:hypothetical protein
MVYTGVFRQSIQWIGKSAGEANFWLKDTNTKLIVGLEAEYMSRDSLIEGI